MAITRTHVKTIGRYSIQKVIEDAAIPGEPPTVFYIVLPGDGTRFPTLDDVHDFLALDQGSDIAPPAAPRDLGPSPG